MPVHAMGLDERHRGCDPAQELVGDRLGPRGRRCRCGSRCLCRWMSVADGLQQAREARVSGDDVALAALEQPAPFGRNRFGILEVILEEVAREAGVQAVDVSHYCLCSNRSSGFLYPASPAACYQRGLLVITAAAMPTANDAAPT